MKTAKKASWEFASMRAIFGLKKWTALRQILYKLMMTLVVHSTCFFILQGGMGGYLIIIFIFMSMFH
jgi:hypothetical protein